MAGSATPPRLLATATVVALLAAGCARHAPRAQDAGPIDATLLELVAPVSGESIRVSQRLRDDLSRAAYQDMQHCLEGLGYRDLPAFTPDRTRFFSFPDADDLREHGFHHYVDPHPGEPDQDDEARGPAYPNDLRRCDERTSSDQTLDLVLRLLLQSWMPIFDRITKEPEEQELWQRAAGCLGDRGYPRAELDQEIGFFGPEQAFVEAGTTLADKQRRERKAANDYVDCAGPVWSARTKAAMAARATWVEDHDEELRKLSQRIRGLR